MIPEHRGHLRSLDGLRGLAILLVMFVHFWRSGDGTAFGAALSQIARLGWAGVDLFFVLSGFLITGILIDSRDRPGSLRSFFARRVLRIFPLYYLFLAISLLLMPAYFAHIGFARVPGFGHAADAAAWPWYVTYASNVWMARHHDFSFGLANSLTWSLAIEEQFYLVWPWLILLCPPRRLLAALAVVFAGAVACRAALVLAGGGWLPVFVLTPCRMDTLAAGGLLAAYLRSPRFDPRTWRRGSLAALCVALPAAAAWIVLPQGDVRETAAFQVAGYSLLALGCAGLLATVLSGGGAWLRKVFDSAPLVSLGKYSYGIYLFHVLLFTAVFPLVYKPVMAFLGIKLVERFFWLFAGIAGSWLLAAGLYHVYEIRFLRLKRYFVSPAATAGAAAGLPSTDASLAS
jgi:peptidoglycan/LPS O-acetylase OafA/YrhL